MSAFSPRPGTQSYAENRLGTRTNRRYIRHHTSGNPGSQSMEVHQASPRRIKKVEKRIDAGLPMCGRVQRLLKRDMVFWT